MTNNREQEAREEHPQSDYGGTQESVSDTAIKIASLKADESSKDY